MGLRRMPHRNAGQTRPRGPATHPQRSDGAQWNSHTPAAPRRGPRDRPPPHGSQTCRRKPSLLRGNHTGPRDRPRPQSNQTGPRGLTTFKRRPDEMQGMATPQRRPDGSQGNGHALTAARRGPSSRPRTHGSQTRPRGPAKHPRWPDGAQWNGHTPTAPRR